MSAAIADPEAERKAFESLRAAAAFKGYTLARSDPDDGPVTYFGSRWGQVVELRTLADAARFVERFGGAFT